MSVLEEGQKLAAAGGPLEATLRREVSRLLRLAERLSGDPREAEDLGQETLLRAIGKHPDLGAAEWRRAWLTRILTNRWLDQVRARARSKEAPAGTTVPERATSPGADPAALAMGEEATERVRRAIAGLPPLQRAIVVLSVDEGFSTAEIARAIDSTPDRVKANLWHARQRLKAELADLLRE